MSGIGRPAARHGNLRRPAGRVRGLRRPAAAFEEAEKTPRERWESGGAVYSHEVTPGVVGSGDWLKSTKAFYFEKSCEFSGKVNRIIIEGADTYLVITLTGTSTEELLKFGSGVCPPVIRALLCPQDCDHRRSNQDLVHLVSFCRVKSEEPKTWEENLAAPDENAPLRQQQEEWEKNRRRDQQEEQEGSSISRGEGEKEKKKKKDKKKGRSKKDRRKSAPKVGGRAVAKKDPQHLYAGTGLDPDPKQRRRLRRKLKRKLKKAKSTSSSSSRSSSSSSSGEVGEEVLEDRSKVQKMAELAPGVLTAASLQQMKTFVLQASGSTWGSDTEVLPPIMSQYVRQHLSHRASGGLLREMVTLAFAADLLLQSRPAEALDAISQRLKSLELVVSGQPWHTALKR